MTEKRRRTLLLLTVPGLLFILVFVFVPLINGFRIAFFTWNGYGKTMKYVGLGNFFALFSDARMLRTTSNTLVYGVGSCLLQNIMGLAAAMFVNRKFIGRNSMRAIIYMPIMISAFIMGKIMSFMFSFENGVFNDIIGLFHIQPVYWLGNSWIAVIIITLVNSWQYMGLCMLIYLAGLQAIPASYMEAAAIDGTSKAQRFLHITIPLLIPSITTCIITNLIGGLKLYELVVGLTNGNPNRETMSLSHYIQLLYFQDEKAGYAAAVGIFMFVLIMVMALPLNKFLRSREVQM